MIRRKTINIYVSSEAILRNTFALEFRIYQIRVWRNLAFGEKAIFLDLACNTGISKLLNFSAR